MSDLIPPRPNHILRTISEEEKGWTVYEYRGATIRSMGVHNILLMPGHPYNRKNFGQVGAIQGLIDSWLDHQRLPRHYVWPPRTPG